MGDTENESLKEKSWFKRNWKWLLPMVIIPVLGFTLLFSVISAGSVGDFASAFSDEKLYQNAIDKANKNVEVQNVLGTLEPVSNMGIVESTVEYTNTKQSVTLSIRVSGEKGKAKMDVVADKKGNEWRYTSIKLRIKEPKREIIVLQ